MTERSILIGWYYGDPERERQRRALRVTAKLEVRAGSFRSVDHSMVTDPIVLSVQGEFDGGMGQIVMSSNEWRPLLTHWATGWDDDRLGELLDLWDRWHLNDLRAACRHQQEHPAMAVGAAELPEPWLSEKQGYPDLIGYRLDTVPPCNEVEPPYHYGRSWLTEALPAEVLAWFGEAFDLPDPLSSPIDDTYRRDGTPWSRGRCDTCGWHCDEDSGACTRNPEHKVGRR